MFSHLNLYYFLSIVTLLISNFLVLVQEIVMRKKYIVVVDQVRELDGDVEIFSSLHVSWEHLHQLIVSCTTLMQQLEDDSDEKSEDSQSDEL